MRLLGIAVVVLGMAWAGSARAQVIQCRLTPEPDGFRGKCADPKIGGPEIHLMTGSSSPRFTLRGTLDVEEGLVPISVAPPSEEFYAAGIVETPYRWMELTSFEQNAEELRFSFDWDTEAPPGPLDLKILDRAGLILSDPAIWDREDDGTCAGEKWSLYCALMQATNDVMGELHHRQPALQLVRREVDEIGGDRVNTHRLVDFNNHPKTTFADVRSVLERAKEQVRAELGQDD